MPGMQLPPSGLAEEILSGMKEQPEELHIVTFNLGEEYGVPISQVQEIVRAGGITRVPNSPSYMEGVINLRGKVLPVLNLRKRLRLQEEEKGKASRIVVTEVGGKVIGLLVDSVSHVVKVSAEFVDSAPEEVLDIETDYITGICRLPRGLVILLDLDKLLKKEKINAGNENEEGTKA